MLRTERRRMILAVIVTIIFAAILGAVGVPRNATYIIFPIWLLPMLWFVFVFRSTASDSSSQE